MTISTDSRASVSAGRLTSLDVFRGATMAAMVIVNDPGDWGSVYGPLLHAEWHGWTPTDLIFPFFLFIVGVSITLSRKSASWSTICRRTAIIFALGLFLNGFPRFDLDTWRIPGVLQRIAICYLIAAAAYHLASRGAGTSRGPAAAAGNPVTSAVDPGASAVGRTIAILGSLAAILALAYWALLMLVPPPGGAGGDLSPEGNLGAHVDRALFDRHMWKPRWDPEGLLSTIPAISTTIVGVIAGLWLASGARPARKAIGLAAAGVAGILLGQLWDLAFPINKNLWTGSYAVFTAGMASLCLGLCYWTIDVRGWRGWTKPFVILGSNAIVLYVASGLLADTLGVVQVTGPDGAPISLGRFVYVNGFVPLASPKNASLLYAIANLIVLFLPLVWLYRRRLFLRV
jgi:predicted acyltransferase